MSDLSVNVEEPRLLIAHQIVADIFWDVVRPPPLPLNVPAFLGVAMAAGAVAAQSMAATARIRAMREGGMI